MSVQTMNEFKILTDASTDDYKYVMASNATEACALFAEEVEGADAITYVSRIKTGISVDVPDAKVKFIASVSDDEASISGCAVYPVTHIVKADQKVIFTAIPADGYTFVNWLRGTDILGTEETLEYAVSALTEDELYADIKAVFTHD